ncbi:MAG: hypothetical protein A2418_03490 [Candidatus Brennerbacteria bacterium RIFOXYC1_FULL_41_11]|uniref:Transcription elongation factor GreA/GreB C-terminal domain-containing protein n=1 Tax=Candidatus Brennerbacteria bacterium RIFOXYD1_FULL_41_16 TaxID=1797529 RepID=A0A1G1XLQ2_9BACT|nr:MAG: hypothetical protein A2391_00550 [Candidatus Brennerbacteria bacterium RIFOXYB1_FULL_41_13]OGY38906.1 MAG: hypothetical protein A2418_03490 [Candidatus Brennerbacteria bacterium RIFOXYC1_FULL_41_11]OGY40540.1 MAG: hypothetical protein A2570_02255 [Candidatus Brennerbacteria bacterium RIFOXYD1_FULL_41_16]
MTNFNKQQVISEVLQELEKRRLELSANVEQFKKSASESSKSTESWSDSSRSQFNMMAGAIQNDIRAVESAAILLKNSASKVAKVTGVGSLVFVEENNQEKYFFIVPESAGGFSVITDGKEIFVVALTSPIGNTLINKRLGELVLFNDRNLKIVSIL